MTDAHLTAYLLDVLEPGQERSLEEALDASSELRARLEVVRSTLAPAVEQDRAWHLPPPGVLPVGWTVHTGRVAVMGDDTLQPGDRFRVQLPDLPDLPDRWVAALVREDTWQVLFPGSSAEVVSASRLPVVDGVPALDLVAQQRPGRQRWAVALPPMSLQPDWAATGDTRWAALQRGIYDGTVPVVSLDVLVGG